MLDDKTPPAWGQDSPLLISRKLARYFLSSLPVLGSMTTLVNFLEKYYPSPIVLRRLYYWLHGANLLRGYRQGLREFQQARVQE
jgi:hypothetical protein